jgi:enoyl-CoA hydratase/carnithine racemase
MSQELLVTHDGGVTTLTLARPPLNLLTLPLLEHLVAAFEELRHRDATRVIVVTGQGERAFCAGADLKAVREEDEAQAEVFRQTGIGLVDLMERHPKPIITAVRGWCIGGGTPIAWAGDLRLLSESARFRAGDIYLGLMPSWGLGNERLVHYIGRNRTLDTILLGEDITAQQAYEWGLATRVFPDATFEEEVARIARKLASGAPLPVQAIKEVVRAQYQDSPDRARMLTSQWVRRIQASEDLDEGLSAARDKRPPVFHGR